MKTAKRNKILMDFAPALRAILSGTAVLAGVIIATAPANAAPVTVNNSNFDTGGYPVVPGWVTDGNSGVNNVSPFGNALWINGSAVVSQTTAEVIAAGTTYTLTVDIGQQNLWAGGGAVIRLYGSDNGPGVALAEFDSGNLPTSGNTLLNQTASFTATAGQATGQFIGIALIGGGGIQVRLDNVRLDAGVGDAVPPSLNDTDPANGASHVVVGANLVATFSEDVAKGTGNIVIKRYDDNTAVETIDVTSGNVTISGADVTINPASDLPNDTQVYVEIAVGAIEDLAGNDFAGISGNGVWTFTTDATAPSHTTLSPGNGDTNVASATNLVITFDENVQEGSGNLVIKESGGSVFETIPFGVSDARISISGAAVTINPTGSLSLSTGYYVEIDNGAIKDLANNNFAGFTGSSTWSFTTGDGLGPITVLNPSFEDGTWGASTASHDSFNPVNWSTAPSTNFRPRSSIGSLTPTDGIRQAWMNNGAFTYQDTGVVIVEGRTYTLKVDLGADQDNFPNIETVTIRLYGSDAGFGTALAEITPNGPGTTQWLTDQTVSFTATAGQATGQTLGIYLAVTGGTQAEWDNVRLEASIGGGGTPYADWAAGQTPPLAGGFGADADGDGTPNGHEFYYYDSDPNTPQGHGSPITGAARTAADKFEFTHNRRLDRTDVTETYQWSPDLDNWYDADGLASDGTHTVSVADKTVVAGPTANLETVTVEATVVGGTMSKLFLRLNLSSP